ncbi:MAG: hypothetical protein ABIH23_24610 [bacterium]
MKWIKHIQRVVHKLPLGIPILFLAILAGHVWGDSSAIEAHIQRLLLWERRVDSPFLLLDRDRMAVLDRMKRDKVLKPLRSAVVDRAHAYFDPDSLFYLGATVWDTRDPLPIRRSSLPVIRYYCAALLDLGFAANTEQDRELRRAGKHLLLRTMDDLRSDFHELTAAPSRELLLRTCEILGGVILSYDLLSHSLDAIERGPFLEALEEERAFLSANLPYCVPEFDRLEHRIDAAACFGLVTLFSSATCAKYEDKKTYRNLRRDFTKDLLWATEMLRGSWQELAKDRQTVRLDDLEYPAFFSVVLMEALRRIGGPDLLPDFPVDYFAKTVWDRKIPEVPWILERTSRDIDPIAPKTWPPSLHNLFWHEGSQPGTGPPTPMPAATPTPTPTPKPILQMIERMRDLRTKRKTPTPTPTPQIGWFPPQRCGQPSALGSVFLFLTTQGNAPAQEIWESGGSGISSHPATISWYKSAPEARRASRNQGPSVWSDSQGQLLMIRSSDRGEIILGREIAEGGESAGNYIYGRYFERRILESVKAPPSGEAASGTDSVFRSIGHVLASHKEGDIEWTTVLRTPISLGLPYLVSIVRTGSDAVGWHNISLPIESGEEVIGATSTTPRMITVAIPEEARDGALRSNQFTPATSRKNHLRLLLSSEGSAQGQLVTEEEQQFFRATQSLQNGVAFLALVMDSWTEDMFSAETAELEKGLGVVIPWGQKGRDLIAVNTGEGIQGPTIETDARLVVLSWDTDHNRVAYLMADGTYLRGTPSLREGPLRDLVRETQGPVTVSWAGRALVLAKDCEISGSYYAPGLLSANQEEEPIVAYKKYDRVTLSGTGRSQR